MTPRYITQTDDLMQAVKEMRETKGMTHLDLDARTGIGDGHSSKVEAFDRAWGKRPFHMLPTIDYILQALGLRLVVMTVEDAEALVSENTTRQIKRVARLGDRPINEERVACVRIKRPQLISSPR